MNVDRKATNQIAREEKANMKNPLVQHLSYLHTRSKKDTMLGFWIFSNDYISIFRLLKLWNR